MSELRVTSKTNTTLQHAKKLRTDRDYRYEQQQFVADGVKLLHEALNWNVCITTVIALDCLELPPLPQSVRVLRVPQNLMSDVSRMQTPQGVVLVCRMPSLPQLCFEKGSLILDGIQDPGNLGTILRTADALGVDVLLSDGCADPYNEKCVRASMGAVFHTVPLQATREQILDACVQKNIPICATALSERAQDIRQISLGDFATVIGSEGKGVCQPYLQAARREAIIPMREGRESMNAAIAATIVMWQLKR